MYPYSNLNLEDRKIVCQKLLKNKTNQIPILLFISGKDQGKDDSYHKYLVPETVTVGDFIQRVRKNVKIDSYTGIFLFTNNSTWGDFLLSPQEILMDIYHKHKAKDGFLYLQIAFENTFGK